MGRRLPTSVIGAIVLLIGMGLLAACSPGEEAAKRPDDFAITYNWVSGSMPPPHHYEYTIKIGPGPNGEMSLTPDYPGPGVQTWKEAFPVSDEALDEIFDLMNQKSVFTREWKLMEDPPIGGSTQDMTVTANGRTYEVPALVEGEVDLIEIYNAIEATVPGMARSNLLAKRSIYEQEQLRENE